MKFTIQGKDTVCLDSMLHKYKITIYADSVGCVSFKLNLAKWMKLADEVESGGGRSCYSTYKSADWFHSDYTFTYCYLCTPRKGHDLMDRGNC